MNARNVLLTGATGVLGGRLLADLLQSTSAHVYCLARGQAPAHCLGRVRALLRAYDTEGRLESEFNSRVTVLSADLTHEHLGLSESCFAELQGKIDLTIHAAANTSLLAKYKRLEPINVQGTNRLIDFCLGTAAKNLAYISTYTVMGDKTFDTRVCFRERDFHLGQGFHHMNYQRSKFRAEVLVRAAEARGLKWRIFRPGQIYGDSVTGAYPHAEAQGTGIFYDLFRTAMDTGVMPEAYSHYDVVPVDYVSRGIVALCAQTDNFFDVYHLVNPDAKNFAQVMELIRQLGYAIDLLPEEVYKQRLRGGEITRNGTPYSSTILKAFNVWYFTSKVSFFGSAKTDCEYTRSKLEQLGVQCAPLNRELIETYVRAGVRAGYFPGPRHLDEQNAPQTSLHFPDGLLSADGTLS